LKASFKKSKSLIYFISIKILKEKIANKFRNYSVEVRSQTA